MHARYVPSGHILFRRDTRLLAVPFDYRTLEIAGVSKVVLENVESHGANSVSISSFSQNGMLVYASVPSALKASLVWVDRAGTEEILADLRRNIGASKLSPDGKDVALIIHERSPRHQADLWLYNLSRETLTRLSVGQHFVSPVWTPDGKHITVADSQEPYEQSVFFELSADGSGDPEVLFEHDNSGALITWTSDGQTLLLEDYASDSSDIFAYSRGGSEARPLIREAFIEHYPSLSPDGQWIAYVSTESGRSEICLRTFPGLDRRIQVSNDGGEGPVWNPNGPELFYVNAGQMMVVAINTEPTLRVGRPRFLFELEENYQAGRRRAASRHRT